MVRPAKSGSVRTEVLSVRIPRENMEKIDEGLSVYNSKHSSKMSRSDYVLSAIEKYQKEPDDIESCLRSCLDFVNTLEENYNAVRPPVGTSPIWDGVFSELDDTMLRGQALKKRITSIIGVISE